LTGRPAGVWTKKEKWTDDSIFAACQERLDEMVRLMRKAAKSVDKDSESKNESLNEIDTKSTV
jgi:hypothetical protein